MTHNRLSRLRRRVFCFGCLLQLIAGQGDGSKGRGTVICSFSGVHRQYMSRPRCIFPHSLLGRGPWPGLSSLFSGKENVHEEPSWGRGLMGEGGPSPLEFFSIFNLDV